MAHVEDRFAYYTSSQSILLVANYLKDQMGALASDNLVTSKVLKAITMLIPCVSTLIPNSASCIPTPSAWQIRCTALIASWLEFIPELENRREVICCALKLLLILVVLMIKPSDDDTYIPMESEPKYAKQRRLWWDLSMGLSKLATISLPISQLWPHKSPSITTLQFCEECRCKSFAARNKGNGKFVCLFCE